MTLKECYELTGSDYEAALSRLGSEEVMDVIVTMFADDDTFSVLKSCIAVGNIEEAQRAAHKLKGITLNIGFDILASSSTEILGALRNNDIQAASAILNMTLPLYERTVDAVKAYCEQKKAASEKKSHSRSR